METPKVKQLTRLVSQVLSIPLLVASSLASANDCADLERVKASAINNFSDVRGEQRSTGNYRATIAMFGLGECVVYVRSSNARLGCSIQFEERNRSGGVRSKSMRFSKSDAEREHDALKERVQSCIKGTPNEVSGGTWTGSTSDLTGEHKETTFVVPGNATWDIKIQVEVSGGDSYKEGQYVVSMTVQRT